MSDSLVTFGQYIYDMLVQNQTPLGLEAVFYGDQIKIPVTPTACVDTGTKARAYDGVPRRTMNQVTGYVIVYHSLVQDIQKTRKEVDQLAEAIETLIHADSTFAGNFIDTLVTQIESGYMNRSQVQYRSSRLTVTGRSQSQLPLART
jgi:hypothetical protein